MKLRTAATAAALALTAMLALTACAPAADRDDMPGMPGMGGSADSAEFNSADVMFAQMMIPHHEQAVEMSDALLAKDGIDEDVAELAERIKAAQQPEIELMEEWLDEWDAGMPGGMDHGDGMMSETDMDALEEATGDEASALFLEQMIEHHEGAIAMAEGEVEAGENPDTVALAEKIIDDQTAEIEEMTQLLAGL